MRVWFDVNVECDGKQLLYPTFVPVDPDLHVMMVFHELLLYGGTEAPAMNLEACSGDGNDFGFLLIRNNGHETMCLAAIC